MYFQEDFIGWCLTLKHPVGVAHDRAGSPHIYRTRREAVYMKSRVEEDVEIHALSYRLFGYESMAQLKREEATIGESAAFH